MVLWSINNGLTSVSRTLTIRRYGCGRLSKNDLSGSVKSGGGATSRAARSLLHAIRRLYGIVFFHAYQKKGKNFPEGSRLVILTLHTTH